MNAIRSLFRCAPTLCVMFAATVASAQTYTPLFTPSSSNPTYAGCVNNMNQLIAYCDVTLSTGYYADTNAHTAAQHSGSAPLSTISPSSGNTGASGALSISINTTAVGHAEYGRVCPSGGTCGNFDYAVGYTIYFVTDHGIWSLVGATAQHGSSTAYNHWMTTAAAYGIYNTTLDYQSHVNPALVSVNDMSLPFGGKFDINGSWSGDHASHLTGNDVDVNGTLDSFMTYCFNNGSTYQVKHSAGNLHCRW